MDANHARDLLGTRIADSEEAISKAFEARRAAKQRSMVEAPTPRLKDKYAADLRELEEAFACLSPANAGAVQQRLQQSEATPEKPKSDEAPGLGEVIGHVRNEKPPMTPQSGLEGLLKKATLRWKTIPPWAFPAAFIIAAVCGLMFWVVRERNKARQGEVNHFSAGSDATQKTPSEGGQEAVEKALAEARVQVPQSPKALGKYYAVLKLDPGNQEAGDAFRKILALGSGVELNLAAKDFTERIVNHLILRASDFQSQGNLLGAKVNYEAILEFEPSNAIAREKITALSASYGRIHVSTQPRGAKVLLVILDEKGKVLKQFPEKAGPASFEDLALGGYDLVVQLDGYDSHMEPLPITGTQLQDIEIKLKRQTGNLKVTSDVEGQKFIARLIQTPAKEEGFEPVERKGQTNGELTGVPTGLYSIDFPDSGRSHQVQVSQGTQSMVAGAGGGQPMQPGGGSTGTYGATSQGTVPLPVTTDKSEYKSGEAPICTIKIPANGYLRVYSKDARGESTVIFPNQFEPDDRVRGGTTLRIPGNDKYDLKLELPPGLTKGTEAVEAVFSEQPFSDSGTRSYSDGPFVSLGQIDADALRTRGLKPQQKSINGSAIYQVVP